jgi:hypothetical protein
MDEEDRLGDVKLQAKRKPPETHTRQTHTQNTRHTHLDRLDLRQVEVLGRVGELGHAVAGLVADTDVPAGVVGGRMDGGGGWIDGCGGWRLAVGGWWGDLGEASSTCSSPDLARLHHRLQPPQLLIKRDVALALLGWCVCVMS